MGQTPDPAGAGAPGLLLSSLAPHPTRRGGSTGRFGRGDAAAGPPHVALWGQHGS